MIGLKLITLILLITASGCLANYPGLSERTDWSLVTSGHVEESSGAYVFTGEVRLSGSTSSPESIRGVRVQFQDGDRSIMETVHIGTMDASRWVANYSVTLRSSPEYVLVLVKEVNGPDQNPPYTIVGLRRVDSGNYLPYHNYDAVED